MSSTILQIFGLNQVKGYKYPSIVVQNKTIPQDQLMGVELEIEEANEFQLVENMRSTEDGSLRNGGVEFITFPANYDSTYNQLQEFFTLNNPHEECYSERTSIHVHMNVQDFTLPQLANVLLIYQTCEHLLYQFVGADRDKNIFCVPLSECYVARNAATVLANGDYNPVMRWQKYTGLNLAPVRSLGTVEFRHMPGNCNMELISTWLKLLVSIMQMAKNSTYDDLLETIITLNSSSAYDAFLTKIFNTHTTHLMTPDYRMLLENGVLAAKYAVLFHKNKQDPKKKILFRREQQVILDEWIRFDAEVPRAMDLPQGIIPNRLNNPFEWNANVIHGANIEQENR